MEGLLQTGETFQSSVHAGGSHAETHGGEATQVHGKSEERRDIFSNAGIGMRKLIKLSKSRPDQANILLVGVDSG